MEKPGKYGVNSAELEEFRQPSFIDDDENVEAFIADLVAEDDNLDMASPEPNKDEISEDSI